MAIVNGIIGILLAIAAIIAAIGIGLAGLAAFIWAFCATCDACDDSGFHPPLVWDDGSIWIKHLPTHPKTLHKKNPENEENED